MHKIYKKNRLTDWMMAFVMVTSVIIAIWALMQWSISHEMVMGLFALKQFFSVGWAFFFLGFARVAIGENLPEGVLTTISILIQIALVSMSLWFFVAFIKGYQPASWALLALQTLATSVLTLPILLLAGMPHLTVKLNNYSIQLSFVLLFLALLTAAPKHIKQPISLPIFFGYFLTYSFLNALPGMMHFGWIEPHPIGFYNGFAHAVMDGIVMFVMLQIRSQMLRNEQLQTQLDLHLSRQQTETEKRHREDQTQLFTMLAHEIKTPLATLRMWMEVGQLKPVVLERAIADMNQIIERCVHTGQLVDQGLEPHPQAVNPLELTRDCVQTCKAPDRVAFSGIGHSPRIETDPQMLSIILGNLLDNALKYSAPDTRIDLSLAPSVRNGHPGWLWRIGNQAGPAGLPDPTHLFEKYYRSPQARRLSGSGLGLFLVKGLVALMHGVVQYQAHDGQAVFTLWLPEQSAIITA